MMKKYFSLCSVFVSLVVQSQTLVFSDDFDSGTSNWTLTGQWGTTTAQAFNGAYSLTDSPGSVYVNNQTTYATTTSSFNLSSALDASLYFKAKYDIENGFDYCYVEMSHNNGSAWTVIHTINGEGNLSNWSDFTISAGGFVGYSQVKLRFRLYTDQGYQSDGIYIDSLRLYSDTVDNAPPLIVHTPAMHYEGEMGVNVRTASITDISGVAVAQLFYTVDGASPQTLNPSDTSGNNYTFEIPTQEAGAYVDYWFFATDSSGQTNSSTTGLFKYVSGNYVKYENGNVGSITSFTTSGNTGAAMRMSLSGTTTPVTALIGNYTDVNNPCDSMIFHVWANNSGNPGSDLITPFLIGPAANLQTPYLITRVDLRPYAAQLSNMTGDIFIGFTVPQNTVWVTQNAGSTNRVRTYNGTNWTTLTTFDFTFRIVTDTIPPNAEFSYDNSGDPVVTFTDESTNFPSTWHWTFGDGDTSNLQNPTHTYNALGAYQVCLTASNQAGSDQQCYSFLISNGPPNAAFGYDASADPIVEFTDYSYPSATQWLWDFGDTDTSHMQHPTHNYLDTGTYQVCLTASNAFGSDSDCQSLHIFNRAPAAFFTSTLGTNNLVTFTDLSSFAPTAWHWDFDLNSDTSIAQNPTYTYPLSGGTYNVCLIASNQYGPSFPYCAEIEAKDILGLPMIQNDGLSLVPNPASDAAVLRFREPKSNISIRLIGLDGRVVLQMNSASTQSMQLDLSNIPSGAYFVEIHADGFDSKLPLIVTQ